MDCDIVIIGAGVVGLAVASELADSRKNVFVLEQHKSFGQETSSRNSEVIHAGIYYPQNSLKAKFCIEGADLLYEICKENKIPYKRIGKLIVAVNENETESILQLKIKGENNGVKGLKIIEEKEIKNIEPNITARLALFSPNTGIIDSHQLMKFYENKAKSKNTSIVYGCKVIGIDKIVNGYRILFNDTDGNGNISTRIIINCAGLNSDKVAEMAGIDLKKNQYNLHYCKGEYFCVNQSKSSIVNGLVYPSPMSELTGLGIHATKDLGNRLKLGPNAFYLDSLNYDVDISHLDEFYESVISYLPFIEKDDLAPDMAGIRPKLQGSKDKFRDFIISHEIDMGLPGFINLIGIESPGLTSSPAIARHISDMVEIYI